MTRSWLAGLITLVAAGLTGVTGPTGATAAPDPVLEIADLARTFVDPGDTVSVAIPFSVRDGLHVQANPAANAFYVPLELVLGSREAAVVDVSYPSSEWLRLAGADHDLLVYHGRRELAVRLVVPRDAPPGRIRVEGHLAYQACGEPGCLIPDRVPVAFELVVRALDGCDGVCEASDDGGGRPR